MSESQTEYETDAKPTPGPWEVNHDGPCPSVHAKDSSDSIAAVLLSADPSSDRDVEANARLIAAAGTAAQEAREMGYDPEKVVRALPKILNEIESLLQGEFEHEGVIFPKITDLLRELGGRPLEKDALASAEGSGE